MATRRSLRSTEEVKSFGLLLFLSAMYGIMSYVAYIIIHVSYVSPLGIDAPIDRFSEARAIEHEGKEGLKEAARYIKKELEMIQARAGPGFRVEVEETLIAGSFNMMFLQRSISLGYRNHTNIIMRIHSSDSKDSDPFLLVNSHFDGPIGSPAAGDCGSCVASMLEMARLIIDSNWIPPRPVIFLFNGAEELFLLMRSYTCKGQKKYIIECHYNGYLIEESIFILGSHGFMTMHELADNIGASINIEASGSGGIDLVCQSGPGSWPSHVYAQSAVYPMAQSSAQDLFGIIPGDTDHRIFSQDYGDIPGLDIIFLIGGYFYHTSYDTLERLLPGSIQARGDNLLSLIKGFTNSPFLQSAKQRSITIVENGTDNGQAVFFDYMSWFMVFYSRKASLILHSLPTIIYLLLPFLLHYPTFSLHLAFVTSMDLVKGTIFIIPS